MTKFSKLAALALLGAIAASPVYAEDKPAAMVNGIAIPQARVDLRVKAAEQQGQPDSPELRKAVREDLITVEIIAQEAAKKGLDKQGDTIQQMELARQSVLAGAFVQDYAKSHPITDDDLKQEYDNLKKNLGNQEYKVRHILVEEESEAKAIAAKLKKGGKNNTFEKLADKSKDAGSKEHGGDLGWTVPSSFVKPFADAVVALKKGQISEPVQSQFGWHIIKLDDVRVLNIPPFEEIKSQIQQRLQQQSVKKAIDDLRDKAKIE